MFGERSQKAFAIAFNLARLLFLSVQCVFFNKLPAATKIKALHLKKKR